MVVHLHYAESTPTLSGFKDKPPFIRKVHSPSRRLTLVRGGNSSVEEREFAQVFRGIDAIKQVHDIDVSACNRRIPLLGRIRLVAEALRQSGICEFEQHV